VRDGAAGLVDCLLEVDAVAVVVLSLITGDGGMSPSWVVNGGGWVGFGG
jgi:hypothetical protein